MAVTLSVNGSERPVDVPGDTPLLYALRDELQLNGARFGCGLGQCGACMVLLDGKAARSCQVTIADAKGKSVTTLEGLGSATAPHPIQAAFIKAQVPQCGYCTSGIVMTVAGLLRRNKKPSEQDVRAELDGNLCRCGTHERVVDAVMSLAGKGA